MSGMRVEPRRLRAGEHALVHFDHGQLRGVVLTLHADAADGPPNWFLSTNRLSGSAPTASAVDHPVPAVGFVDAGPDAIVLPDDVPPGIHWLCTGGPSMLCAEIEVVTDDGVADDRRD